MGNAEYMGVVRLKCHAEEALAATGASKAANMSHKRPRSEAEEEALREREDRLDPVSLEDLLEAKKAEKAALSKPKFLNPDERAQIAIRRREAQVASKRA